MNFLKKTMISIFNHVTSFVLGDNSEGVHLFPFRTEKLSPSAPMVLGG